MARRAVISSGGKQYIVEEGQTIQIERLDGEAGTKVTIDTVLAIKDGEQSLVGSPYVAGASVEGTVQSKGLDDKVVVFKKKRRKQFKRKRGHRQLFTAVRIDRIVTAG